MEIGIGLPNTLPIAGPDVLAWARRAEERGFRSLGTIDRVVYPSYDSLTALAAAAGATSTIRLFTDILLGPAYPPVWLAKATASLDALSGGRLRLGIAVGGRPDDYAAMERPFERRGALMDRTLDVLRRSWAGEPVAGGGFPVGPPPANGRRVPLIIGGTSDAAVRRVVEYGDGWTAGGGGPQMAAPIIGKVRTAWRDAGREGEPWIAALMYVGLGDAERSRAMLRRYYGFLGEWVERVVESAPRTPGAVRDAVRAFEDIGVDELVLDPTVADLGEVDRIADAVR